MQRGAQSDYFVRVQVGQRLPAKKGANGLLHLRHPGGAADHHHALHFSGRQFRIAQCPAHRSQRTGCQMGCSGLKIDFFNIKRDCNTLNTCGVSYQFSSSQRFFAGACSQAHGGFVAGSLGAQAQLLQHPIGQCAVVVVTAQGRVAAGGNHFKHALRQAQDGNIEGAAAQVVHGIDAFAGVVQTIGNRGGRGLVDQAQ